MSLLQRLKNGTNNKKTIKYPGTNEDVTIRVLSEADRLEAAIAAEDLFKSRNIDISMSTVDIYEAEKTSQLLFRALRAPDGKIVAKDINEFRGLLTTDEKDVLVDEYSAHEKECSPSLENLSEEAFKALLNDVKKNAGQTVSNVSSISTLRRLICSLASLPQNSQTDSGSTS